MSGDTKSWSHKPSCQHSLSTLDSTQKCQSLVQHLWIVIFLKRQLPFPLPNPSAKESHHLQTTRLGPGEFHCHVVERHVATQRSFLV